MITVALLKRLQDTLNISNNIWRHLDATGWRQYLCKSSVLHVCLSPILLWYSFNAASVTEAKLKFIYSWFVSHYSQQHASVSFFFCLLVSFCFFVCVTPCRGISKAGNDPCAPARPIICQILKMNKILHSSTSNTQWCYSSPCTYLL